MKTVSCAWCDFHCSRPADDDDDDDDVEEDDDDSKGCGYGGDCDGYLWQL